MSKSKFWYVFPCSIIEEIDSSWEWSKEDSSEILFCLVIEKMVIWHRLSARAFAFDDKTIKPQNIK